MQSSPVHASGTPSSRAGCSRHSTPPRRRVLRKYGAMAVDRPGDCLRPRQAATIAPADPGAGGAAARVPGAIAGRSAGGALQSGSTSRKRAPNTASNRSQSRVTSSIPGQIDPPKCANTAPRNLRESARPAGVQARVERDPDRWSSGTSARGGRARCRSRWLRRPRLEHHLGHVTRRRDRRRPASR